MREPHTIAGTLGLLYFSILPTLRKFLASELFPKLVAPEQLNCPLIGKSWKMNLLESAT